MPSIHISSDYDWLPAAFDLPDSILLLFRQWIVMLAPYQIVVSLFGVLQPARPIVDRSLTVLEERQQFWTFDRLDSI